MAQGARWHVPSGKAGAAVARGLTAGRVVAVHRGVVGSATTVVGTGPAVGRGLLAVGVSGRLLRLLAGAEEIVSVEEGHG